MQTLNENTFKELISTSTKPVVIDYFAPWCGPCRALTPLFERWAKENENVTFAKVNVDDANSLAAQYGINAIPAVLIFKEGKEIKRFVGIPQEKELLEALK